MYCSYCGSSNSEGNKFCLNCGKPLDGKTAPAQRVPAAASAPAQAPAPAPAVHPYAKGCFASAWEDVRSTDGWMKKVLLLGLVMLVPILNLFVTGYAVSWAKEIACGKRAAMPKKIFADGNFATGFFVAVLSALFVVALYVFAILAIWIPVIGLIALCCFAIFGAMMVAVCAVRIGMSGRLTAGFDFSSVWQACSGNWSALFCSSIVPGFVISLVGYIVAFVLLFVAGLLVGINAASLPYLFGGTYGYTAFGAGTVVILVLFLLADLYIALTTTALTVVVEYRAVGHWVNRTAPNWASELGAQPYVAPAQPVQQSAGYTVPVVPPVPAPVATPAPAPAPTPVQQAPAPAPQPAPNASVSAGDSGTTNLSALDNAGDSATTVLADESAKTLVLIRADGAEVRVSAFPATLGKGTAADVQISGNNSISRVHARVIAANGGFAIEDLGSTNKTFINDNPLEVGEVVALHCGDELKLGSENLIVRF